MSAKHTPGPRRVSEKKANGTKAYVDCAGGYAVAQAYCSPSVKIKFNDLWSEAESNARLIAAAPDMLEALQGLLTGVHADGYILPAGAVATAKARAAIAKATGEVAA